MVALLSGGGGVANYVAVHSRRVVGDATVEGVVVVSSSLCDWR